MNNTDNKYISLKDKICCVFLFIFLILSANFVFYRYYLLEKQIELLTLSNTILVEGNTFKNDLLEQYRNQNTYDLDLLIDNLSEALDIPISTIHSIIRIESNWDIDALSYADCRGLMQMSPWTAKYEFGILNSEDLYNPYINVVTGCIYFKTLLNRYNGDYVRSLVAYNAGPTLASNCTYPEKFPYVLKYNYAMDNYCEKF